MVKQTKSKQCKQTHEHAIKKLQVGAISKPRISKNQIREKIFENIKLKNNLNDSKSRKINTYSTIKKFNLGLQTLIKQQQLTCSICYDIMVGPVVIECGHGFCLSCMESAFYTNEHCPLCRKNLEFQTFQCSKHMQALINQFLRHKMTNEERKDYEQRELCFNRNEAKRALPSNLQIGDFVDYNDENKWNEAKVQQISKKSLVLTIYDKKQKTIIFKQINLDSRRLAKHRTFTKEPPLRPTFYSKIINFTEPVLRYIVEDPSFSLRRRNNLQQVNTESNQNEDMRGSNWDEFESVQHENNWVFSDNEIHLPHSANSNFWNVAMEDTEDNQLSIFN